MTRRVIPVTLFLSLFFVLQGFAQVDPGVRGGAAGAGAPLASVAANNPVTILNFFNDAKGRFTEIDSVSGTVAGEAGFGLGPRYNSRSCVACHAQPAVGGSAPATNPQVGDATADGATNTIPSFISSTGPVREARFPFFFDANGNPDFNRPNGGVEDLYTITGRVDAPAACNTTVIVQPGFPTAVNTGNIIFRIPTPTFGTGLMENIDDSTLLTNFNNQQNNNVGVTGTFNHNGNDGTISRFGWKAQNKSLEIFAGEAYNVEMGVSNELFTQERPLPGEDQ
ncbi:MAG TPA: di-heme oxidoredictase family protein, partial [Thermoanaerobaculia bacterium]|nr:di-heme oxidoredictase family protein [Thermoanaerobaculia bacterium]